jgi:predicted DNA-binding transcriptional regulator YafY
MSIFAPMPQTLRGEKRAERRFYWRWPSDGRSWFAWAFQNYGSKWISWRVGPLNYEVQIAEPGQCGGYIRPTRSE